MTTKSLPLFWTGGWDSTFRLMELVINENKTVQPHYIIDPERSSAGIELYATKKIKHAMDELQPNAGSKILPTVYTNKLHIEPDVEVTQAWNRLKQKFRIGTQYEWLPRYCKQMNINGMEVSLFMDHNLANASPFRKCYTKYFCNDESINTAPFGDEVQSDLEIIFQHMKAPLMKTTKPKMYRYAVENDWMSVLNHINFCHNPNTSIRPCGTCRPCEAVIEDNMTWQIPLKSKLDRLHLQTKIFLKSSYLKCKRTLYSN